MLKNKATEQTAETTAMLQRDIPLRLIRGASNTIDRAILICLIAALLFGIYYVYDVAYAFYHSNGERIQGYKPEEITEETLREISGDAIAWITVPDTKIDYPVMQGKDNVEYLNKAPDGSYSISGSLFLDTRNRADFSDDYNLIYGHHMEGGLMLGALDQYIDEEFFEAHKTGALYTKDSEYEITFFAYLHADANTKEIFGVGEDANPRTYVPEHAIVYRPVDLVDEHGVPYRWIALSTCKSPETTERRIVFGVMKEVDICSP